MKRFIYPAAAVVVAIVVIVVLVGFVGLPVRGGAVVEGTPIATSGGAQVVQVRATEMQFAPNAIVVRVGEPVELTLTDDGKSVHDFTLSDGVAQPVKVLVQPGQSGHATFTFEHPGTYNFVCSQPFHAAQGMRGTFIAR